MEKHLVVLENDLHLSGDRHDYPTIFWKRYVGKSTLLTNLRTKTREQIYSAVSKATDIVVQSTLAYGADEQLHSMVELLAKLEHSIKIHIKYLGLSNETLYDFLCKELSAEELMSIQHHEVYDFPTDYLYEYDDNDSKFIYLDFSTIINAYKEQKLSEQKYKTDSRYKVTGLKVKVLACNANGEAFKNLPLGQVVDVIDYTTKGDKPERGVWIWGNGEPIKLVNDCGLQEYEVVITDVKDAMMHIVTTINELQRKFTRVEKTFFETVITDVMNGKKDSTTVANLICEEFDLEKRGNRQIINSTLLKLKPLNV